MRLTHDLGQLSLGELALAAELLLHAAEGDTGEEEATEISAFASAWPGEHDGADWPGAEQEPEPTAEPARNLADFTAALAQAMAVEYAHRAAGRPAGTSLELDIESLPDRELDRALRRVMIHRNVHKERGREVLAEFLHRCAEALARELDTRRDLASAARDAELESRTGTAWWGDRPPKDLEQRLRGE
jgi:hypothetical protein